MAIAAPYAYRPGSSPLHRLPPLLKLAALLAISAAAFLFGVPAIAFGAAVVLAAAVVAGIRPLATLSGGGPLIALTASLALVKAARFAPPYFDPADFLDGLRFAAAVVVSFAAGSVLFSTTTVAQFRDSLAHLEAAATAPTAAALVRLDAPWARRAASRLRGRRFSLGVSLMLAFLPRVFEAWEAAETAYRARLGRKGLAFFFRLTPLVVERLVEAAAESARALRARGADFSRYR